MDKDKCQCRLWKNGLDNIQCSRQKKHGLYCSQHFKIITGKLWWLGLITEPRPENPIGGTKNTPHYWHDQDKLSKKKRPKKQINNENISDNESIISSTSEVISNESCSEDISEMMSKNDDKNNIELKLIELVKDEVELPILNIKMKDTNKRCKTPLRYAGGKSKAIYKLEKHLPDMNTVREFHDCFLGGGSLPIYISKLYPNLKIKVNDIYKPLYNFWIQLRDNGIKMSDKLLEIKNNNDNPELARVLFESQKVVLENIDSNDFDKGVAFYIINKCGFSGLVSSSFSSMASVSNFSVNGINNLKYYNNLMGGWEITNYDYRDFIEKNSNKKDVLLYLDPPYMIGPNNNLYGDHGNLHKVFRHEDFFDVCHKYNKCNQLISYNSNNLIKDAFKGYKISDYDLTYTLRSTGKYMEDQKERKELAIRNY
jgi:DNA adenine methylase